MELANTKPEDSTDSPGGGDLEAASRLFNSKWPRVRKIVGWFALRRRWPAWFRDDVEQAAALHLWGRCLQGVSDDEVSALVTAQAGMSCELRKRRRWLREHAEGSMGARPDGEPAALQDLVPAPMVSIRDADGVRFTLADVLLDNPELEEIDGDGLTVSEAADVLGMTTTRVHKLLDRLGAWRVGSRWRIPREGVNRFLRERHARRVRQGWLPADSEPVTIPTGI